AGAVAVITSYMWVPFLVVPGYINESYGSPYIRPTFYDSFGAPTILGWLVSGQLLDAGRVPMFTLLCAVGIAAAIRLRSRPALAVLAIVLLIPAMRERWTYYTFNNEWLGDTRAALAADTDARDLIARVRELGGGRVYAGMRNNWGESLGFGLPFRGVKLYNL